jgi:hypothetical protein
MALACLAACGSPSPAETDAGAPDARTPNDAAPRADAGPRLEAVNLAVRDPLGPLIGATVVVDDARGERHTTITGPDGRARFSSVGWGPDRISITAFAEAHPIVTLANFRRAELGERADRTGLITIELFAYYDAVSLRGSFTNVAAPTDYFFVSPDVFGDLRSTGTTYTGALASDTPFNLYAYEAVYTETSRYGFTYVIARAVQVTHPALTRAAVLDIDMSASLPLTTVTGSFPVPADGNRVQAGYPNMIVTARDTPGRPTLGFATAMDLAPDGVSMDFTVSYLGTIGSAMPRTLVYFITEERLYTQITLASLPTASPIAAATEFLAPPRVTSPTTQPLSAPIALADIDPTTDVQLSLDAGYSVWDIQLPRGATQLVIPAPPDAVDTSSWTDLTATVFACEPWAGRDGECRRLAGGDVVSLAL